MAAKGYIYVTERQTIEAKESALKMEKYYNKKI